MSRDPVPEAAQSLEYITAALERIAAALERAHPADYTPPTPQDEPPLPTYPFGTKPTANVMLDPDNPTPTAHLGLRVELWGHPDVILSDAAIHVDDDGDVSMAYRKLAMMLLAGGWSMTYPERFPEERRG